MNSIELLKLIDPDNKQPVIEKDLSEDFVEEMFRQVNKVAKILLDYVNKHELKSETFGETYFQSDHVMIEGSQEVFPAIMEILLKEINQ